MGSWFYWIKKCGHNTTKNINISEGEVCNSKKIPETFLSKISKGLKKIKGKIVRKI